MKMVEIKMRSITTELEKLYAKLERAEKKLAKATARAEKAGVIDWTAEDRQNWMETVETNEWHYIVNKEDIEKNGAWMDLFGARYDIKDIQRRIENTEARAEKAQEKVAEYHKQVEALADLKQKEELRKLEFEAEQKEWAKDGITLEDRYTGITPNGKRFGIWGNSGVTTRSWHCFTLYIDGEVIFTSGEFWRAYSIIKKS